MRASSLMDSKFSMSVRSSLDTSYLPVMLNVPTLPGTYTVVFRMTTADGKKFGEPLHVLIEVEDEELDAPPAYEEYASAPSSPLQAVPVSIPQTINDLPEYDVPEFIEPEAPVEEEVAPAPAPAEQFAFPEQLEQLKVMGFQNDEETLKSVLVVTNGDIAQAI